MSSKTLPEKMYVKEEYTIYIKNPPESFFEVFQPLPNNVTIINEYARSVNIIIAFITSQKDLKDLFLELADFQIDGSHLWVAYPKSSSKIKSDLKRDIIYELAQNNLLKGIGMVSIDKNWTGFRFKKL